MSNIVYENDQCIKDGESVFYGLFDEYLWRDEKNGVSFFQMSTRQRLLMKEQYRKKQTKKNQSTNEDEDWFTMTCEGTEANVPLYKSKTPIRVTGYFKNRHQNKCGYWDFHITSIKEASQEETVTIEYLATFPGISYENAVIIVKNHGYDIFTFVKSVSATKKLVEETGLDIEVVSNLVNAIENTTVERELFEFLSPLQIPYPACIRAVKHYGKDANEKLRENPYQVGQKIGLGFMQCDRIAKKCGFEAHNKNRLKAACYESLTLMGANGHTWAPQKEFYRTVSRVLNTPDYMPVTQDYISYGMEG